MTPGFLGVGRLYIGSPKFIRSDGGIRRLVWMPKELKTLLADDLKKRFADQGAADLMDKIADETVCEDAEKLVEHLTKVGHPALEMEPIVQ